MIIVKQNPLYIKQQSMKQKIIILDQQKVNSKPDTTTTHIASGKKIEKMIQH